MNIRVRGWDTKKNQMYSPEEMGKDQLCLSPDGRGFVNVSGASTRLSKYYSHIKPLMSTGLKDKKRTEEYPEGQEIFEGDICEGVWQVDKTTIVRGFVKYYSRYGLYAIEQGEDNMRVMTNACWESCEVIGSVHANPELLK